MAKKSKKSLRTKPTKPSVVGKSSGISPVKILAIIAMVVAGGFLAYSALSYQNSEEEHVGFFVCNKENTVCELSQHIHADIHVTACGKDIVFAKEKGRTDKQHTHKENNKIHWHAQLKVDPQTREPLDSKILTIAAFLEQMEYVFPATCENNAQPVTTVEVNNTVTERGLNYVWKDGDVIKISYN